MDEAIRDVWQERLKCHVVGLTYDFVRRAGELRITPGECCGMEGCLDLFRGIDPEVEVVITFSGQEKDTVYRKLRTGWEAFTPRLRP